jgi:hypothetical protein
MLKTIFSVLKPTQTFIKPDFNIKIILFYFFGFSAFSIFSLFTYALTAPNLVLSSWSIYWNFQTTMWEVFFNHRQLLTIFFVTCSFLLFGWYFLLAHFLKKISFAGMILTLTVVAVPLVFSSTALSYDVFNYIFNAKMVSIYQANPHQQTAQNFSSDELVRFMHNTHTPAPYGYGWTAVSLLPFTIGYIFLDSFVATWLLFRALMIAGVLIFFLMSWSLSSFVNHYIKSKVSFKIINHKSSIKKRNKLVSMPLLMLFLTNPLVLIETISSIHNDIWMMWPAVLSLLMMAPLTLKAIHHHFGSVNFLKLLGYGLISMLLLLFSVFLKLATVVLTPLWILFFLQMLNKFKSLNLSKFAKKTHEFALNHWSVLASVLLFLPLISERSKMFLPWYLIWSLAWIPFFTFQSKLSKLWLSWLIALSIAVFFRYVPFLLAGNYEPPVAWHQLLITWGGGMLLTPIVFVWISKFKILENL